MQSVKEVLQSLVDDRLVRSSFDAFPLQLLVHIDRSRQTKLALVYIIGRFHPMPKDPRQIKLEELNKELQTLQQRKEELENSIQEESAGREDSV